MGPGSILYEISRGIYQQNDSTELKVNETMHMHSSQGPKNHINLYKKILGQQSHL